MYNNKIMTRTITVLDGITATDTGNAVNIAGAKKISIQCICADHSSGNGAFAVTVSNDGTNFATYNRLISNATNVDTKTIVRVASLTLSADGTDFVSFSPEDGFKYMKVACTVTTDGTYTAIANIEE